ncbi:MAG: TolC family protein [Campylobacterota bacterium]|nr:TolC family protein [Campylobacterota bacterium]
MKTVAFLVTSIISMHAADVLYSDRLNLSEAIELLKANNLEIKAADYDLKSAQASRSQANGTHWGTLDFIQNISRSDDAGNVFGFKLTGREATFGDFGAEEFMNNFGACQGGDMAACGAMYTQPPEDLNNPGDRNFFQSKLQYSLPLYVGGKISGYVTAAESMEKLKTLDKTKLLNLKIYETRKAFYDMKLLEEVLKNLHTLDDNIASLEAMAESMIEEGYAKHVDLLEVQAKRSNIKRSIRQMEANKELLYHYLSFLLNQEITTIEIPNSDIAIPNFRTEDIIERNVDVQRAKTGLEIRRSMKDIEQADYLPMIGVQANVQTAAEGFDEYAIDKGSYTLGAQLKWNIFNGGADYAKVEKARLEVLKTETQVELAKKGIALQVDKIRTEIKSLDFEITALEHELDLANTIYHSYEERYREQLSSMSDVIIKQSLQLEKVLALLEVKNRRLKRLFALEKIANGAQ